MSDEFPIKIDPGPPKKKDPGFLGTGIGSGVVITVVLVILARGIREYARTAPDREKARAFQQEFERQREEGIRTLNEEIQKTPPEKMGKAMKMLLGIKDDERPAASNVDTPAANPPDAADKIVEPK